MNKIEFFGKHRLTGVLSKARRAPLVAALAGLSLGACSTLSVPASAPEHQAAARLPVFMASDTGQPAVRTVVGSVEGLGCEPQRDQPLDAKAQEDGALEQLRVKAVKLGANGIIGVRYEKIQTDRRNACWRGVSATGTAVLLETVAAR